MILSWFDAAEAKKFGDSLGRFFIERMSPISQVGDKKFAVKTDKVLHQMTGQIARFKQVNKLNTYKKAQLGNAFKWVLKDAGVASEYTDELTKWLMLQIG